MAWRSFLPKRGPNSWMTLAMSDRPRACPWVNRPTHRKNRDLMVDGYRPIVYGYCPQVDDCASCAGTGYKPNLEVRKGRDFDFVPCPYCRPEDYQRRVERLKAKLPK